jgi:hypothetical protein
MCKLVKNTENPSIQRGTLELVKLLCGLRMEKLAYYEAFKHTTRRLEVPKERIQANQERPKYVLCTHKRTNAHTHTNINIYTYVCVY